MVRIRLSFFLLISMSILLFSSCGFRGKFLIENNTDKVVILEITYDSLDFIDILAHGIAAKTIPNEMSHYKILDSLKQNFERDNKLEFIKNQLTDSIQFKHLFRYTDFNIYNNKEQSTKEYALFNWGNDTLTASSYYQNNPELINKIFEENTLTLTLPSDCVFEVYCHACGDCTCWAVDFLQEASVKVIADDEVILIHKDNVKKMMRTSRVFRTIAHYELKLKDSWFW